MLKEFKKVFLKNNFRLPAKELVVEAILGILVILMVEIQDQDLLMKKMLSY
jgi:hypothetical protein